MFDFATSAIARGDIELHARQNKPIPADWALDLSGNPTTDAQAALKGAMQTFGGHKGSSLAFDAGASATPCHGELILAFDPKVFLGDAYATSLQQAEALFESITEQGARLPS